MVRESGLWLGLGALALVTRSWAYTWPAQTDFLESVYYQQIGHNGLSFGLVVKTCGFKDNFAETGRTNTAEWIRTAYHDMSTADIEAGTGGLDASISFELGRPENVGKGFIDAINAFLPFMSTGSSMADLIALGVVMSVTACTISADRAPTFIPLRGGRIDATGPGPEGVPRPEENLESHTSKFAKQGFNTTEMIALVACGHSLGGVHGVDFPQIVPELNDTSRQNFDGTVTQLDNSRMLNTVPKDVELSAPIDPVPVKPDNIEIKVDSNGNMTITGEIRVNYLPVSANYVGNGNGLYPYSPTFGWFEFTTSVPAVLGASSFTIEVVDSSGNSTTYDNNGNGFPLATDIIPQIKSSCASLSQGYIMNITAAVLDEANFSSVNFTVDIPTEQPGSVVPRFEPTTFAMTKTGELPGTGYSLYSGAMNVAGKRFSVAMSYSVHGKREGGDADVSFFPWRRLPGC
ncbi:heme peroxidase [Thozetella sp. PMI_491]|nr:heme peroxidase [Thozetella sp. PMI_491]